MAVLILALAALALPAQAQEAESVPEWLSRVSPQDAANSAATEMAQGYREMVVGNEITTIQIREPRQPNRTGHFVTLFKAPTFAGPNFCSVEVLEATAFRGPNEGVSFEDGRVSHRYKSLGPIRPYQRSDILTARESPSFTACADLATAQDFATVPFLDIADVVAAFSMLHEVIGPEARGSGITATCSETSEFFNFREPLTCAELDSVRLQAESWTVNRIESCGGFRRDFTCLRYLICVTEPGGEETGWMFIQITHDRFTPRSIVLELPHVGPHQVELIPDVAPARGSSPPAAATLPP